MRYLLELIVNEQVVKTNSFKVSGQRTDAELKSKGDELYFKYIEGPDGPPCYPEAILQVTSKAPQVDKKFIRRAGSNAAGMPSLWKIHISIPTQVLSGDAANETGNWKPEVLLPTKSTLWI